MAKHVIIDTDPGIDDSLALLLALRSPELQVEGITVVAGNDARDVCARNAAKVCRLAGVTPPLALGADQPLVRPRHIAPFKFGTDGLGDLLPDVPDVRFEAESAVRFITRRVLEGEVRELVALGPLTNLALAIREEPRLSQKLERVTLMGGSVRREGNMTLAAEFNFWADPEAARILFRSGIPITMVGLNVTMRAVLPHTLIRRLLQLPEGNLRARFVGKVTDYYAGWCRRAYGIDGAALHDPLAVAAVIDPSVIHTRSLFVDVETQGELTRGQSLADFWGVPAPWGEPNCDVALDLQAERFLDLFVCRVVPELAS